MSIREIQNRWQVLDEDRVVLPTGVSIISHEAFSFCADFEVSVIPRHALSSLLSRFSTSLGLVVYAFQLLIACKRSSVLLVNGGVPLWWFVGILNRLPLVGHRCVMCWDVFVEVRPGWRQWVFAVAMKGMTLSVLWSKAQVTPHAKFLGMDEARFIFLPFKANHSKNPPYTFPENQFVFSGGNGKRDYECLVKAVEGTGIPVIISATDQRVRETIRRLPNIILLSAAEPAFAQLQAASRFVVYSMQHTGLKGGGEANFCNGMWHGKPVIAADSIAASDYIVEGNTGFIVPAGDCAALRDRISRLWNDSRLSKKMGEAARQHCVKHFTHQAFIRRLLTVAAILGQEYHELGTWDKAY